MTAGANGFDFLIGHWRVQHRLWSDRHARWLRFESDFHAWTILDGAGNMDRIRVDALPPHPFIGSSIRVFDPSDAQWSIGWVDNLSGRFGTVVRGTIHNGNGTFTGERTDDVSDPSRTRRVIVRFRWRRLDDTRLVWDQAWSNDGAATWQPRWVMRFRREPPDGRSAQ